MEKKVVFTKVLAVTGSVLVWFPVLAPFLLSLGGMITRRMFRFDYLIPAELFPFTLLGGGLLLWAALRAHMQRGLIGWGLGAAFALLFGGQGFAVATGLASGKTEPIGWVWTVALGSMIAYFIALVLVGVGGALMLRDLFKSVPRINGS